ncbi:hypothetical protein AU375_03977 [Methylobacterium radiotolerans]|nr:hypothetical protein AU375_03977 [Methylobacterium radiotolerans]
MPEKRLPADISPAFYGMRAQPIWERWFQLWKRLRILTSCGGSATR